MTSRRRAKRAEQDQQTPLFVAVDFICEGTETRRHDSQHVWRFGSDTGPEASAPSLLPGRNVWVRMNRQGDLPFNDPAQLDAWRDERGIVWVPMDCRVCGTPRQWPYDEIFRRVAAVWAPGATAIERVVLDA